MYTSIFQNSYVMLILSFVILSILCYFLQFGYTTELQNGKIVKKFSWKYPLAISLIIWVIWHFFLFPPPSVPKLSSNNSNTNYTMEVQSAGGISSKTNRLMAQKINMVNWN